MKINKTIYISKAVIILFYFMIFTGFSFASSVGVPILEDKQNVYDESNLYSEDTEKYLNETIQRIKQNYNADLVFVTVNSLNGISSQQFADDYFYYNNFGGSSGNGIVFLVSPGERDWAISTNGDSISVFTDAGQKYIMKSVLAHLKEDDYDSATKTFATHTEDFYNKAQTDKPYDVGNLPFKLTFFHYIGTLAASIFISVGICVGFLAQLKSVKYESNANNYQELSNVQVLRESFVTSSVISRKIEKNSSSGGSSTHSSSGGMSGGSSGKY